MKTVIRLVNVPPYHRDAAMKIVQTFEEDYPDRQGIGQSAVWGPLRVHRNKETITVTYKAAGWLNSLMRSASGG